MNQILSVLKIYIKSVLVIHSISGEIESFNKFVLSCVSTGVQKMLDLSPWLTTINGNGDNF